MSELQIRPKLRLDELTLVIQQYNRRIGIAVRGRTNWDRAALDRYFDDELRKLSDWFSERGIDLDPGSRR